MSPDIFLVQTRSCLGIYFKKHFFNPHFSEAIYLWSFYYNMRNLHANMSHFVPRDWNGEYIFVNFLIYQTLLCFISHFVQTSKWETFTSRLRIFWKKIPFYSACTLDCEFLFISFTVQCASWIKWSFFQNIRNLEANVSHFDVCTNGL